MSITPKKNKARGAVDVLEVLRSRIADHDLSPGTKLRENDLAGEFGVSRARIREAFGALEQRGLIERIPNRGAVVTRLDAEQIYSLYDVREVLEALCVRLATENVPPETWQDMVALFGAPAEKAIEKGDLDTYTGNIDTFRRLIIEAAQNDVLAGLLDGLHERTRVLIRRLLLVPGRAKEGLKDHRAILAAMRRGDAAEAERLKRANIHAAKECFRRYQKYIL